MRWLGLLALVAWTGIARADNETEAKRLFDEAHRLAKQGNKIAACERFTQSFELVAAPGTMLNVAECHESAARPLQAWQLYDAAARELERTNQPERAKFARNRADAVLANFPEVAAEIKRRDEERERERVAARARELVSASVEPPSPAPAQPHPLTQAAARAAGGGMLMLREISFDQGASGSVPPPRDTASKAIGVRFEGEVYPMRFAVNRGPFDNLGVWLDFERAIGLSASFQEPMAAEPESLAVTQQHYALGLRYRHPLGASSLAFGAGFYRRVFTIDRSPLLQPETLDLPDVAYQALSVGVGGRIAFTPKAAGFVGADLLMMFAAGPISDADSYGKATVIGVEVDGGIEVTLRDRIALRFGFDITQIGFTFDGTGNMAQSRGITEADDRVFGLAAMVTGTY